MNPLEGIEAFILAVMLAFVTFVKLAEEVTRNAFGVLNSNPGTAITSPSNVGEEDQTSPGASEGTDIDNPWEAYKETPPDNATPEEEVVDDDDDNSSSTSSERTIVNCNSNDELGGGTDEENDLQETHQGPPLDEECIQQESVPIENCQWPGNDLQELSTSGKSGDDQRMNVGESLGRSEIPSHAEQINSQEVQPGSRIGDICSVVGNGESDVSKIQHEIVRTYVNGIIQSAVDQVTDFLDSQYIPECDVDQGVNSRVGEETECADPFALSSEKHPDDSVTADTFIMGGDVSKTEATDVFTPANIDDIDLVETKGPSGDPLVVVDHKRDQPVFPHSDTSEKVGKDSLASPPKSNQEDDDNAIPDDGSSRMEEAPISLENSTPEESVLLESNPPQKDNRFDENSQARTDDGSDVRYELNSEGAPQKRFYSPSGNGGSGDENGDEEKHLQEKRAGTQSDESSSSSGSEIGETGDSVLAQTMDGNTETEIPCKDIESQLDEENDEPDERMVVADPGSSDIVHTEIHEDFNASKAHDDTRTQVGENPISFQDLTPEESVPVENTSPQLDDRLDGSSHDISGNSSDVYNDSSYGEAQRKLSDIDNEEQDRGDEDNGDEGNPPEKLIGTSSPAAQEGELQEEDSTANVGDCQADDVAGDLEYDIQQKNSSVDYEPIGLEVERSGSMSTEMFVEDAPADGISNAEDPHEGYPRLKSTKQEADIALGSDLGTDENSEMENRIDLKLPEEDSVEIEEDIVSFENQTSDQLLPVGSTPLQPDVCSNDRNQDRSDESPVIQSDPGFEESLQKGSDVDSERRDAGDVVSDGEKQLGDGRTVDQSDDSSNTKTSSSSSDSAEGDKNVIRQAQADVHAEDVDKDIDAEAGNDREEPARDMLDVDPDASYVVYLDTHKDGYDTDPPHNQEMDPVTYDGTLDRSYQDDLEAVHAVPSDGPTRVEEAPISLENLIPEESVLLESNPPQKDNRFNENSQARSDDDLNVSYELEPEGAPQERSNSYSGRRGSGGENGDEEEHMEEERAGTQSDESSSPSGSGIGETGDSVLAQTIEGNTESEIPCKDIESQSDEENDELGERMVAADPGSSDIVHIEIPEDFNASKVHDDTRTRFGGGPISFQELTPEESVPVENTPPQPNDRLDEGNHDLSGNSSDVNDEPSYEEAQRKLSDVDNEELDRSDEDSGDEGKPQEELIGPTSPAAHEEEPREEDLTASVGDCQAVDFAGDLEYDIQQRNSPGDYEPIGLEVEKSESMSTEMVVEVEPADGIFNAEDPHDGYPRLKSMEREDDTALGSDLGTDENSGMRNQIDLKPPNGFPVEIKEDVVSFENQTSDQSLPVESNPLQPDVCFDDRNQNRPNESPIIKSDPGFEESSQKGSDVDSERRDAGDVESDGAVAHSDDSPDANSSSSASDSEEGNETAIIQAQAGVQVEYVEDDIDVEAGDDEEEPARDVLDVDPDASYVVYLDTHKNGNDTDPSHKREMDPVRCDEASDRSYQDDLEAVHGSSSSSVTYASESEDASLTSVSEDETRNEYSTQRNGVRDGIVQLPDNDQRNHDDFLDNSKQVEETITFQENSTDETTPDNRNTDETTGSRNISSPKKVYTDEDVRNAIKILTSRRPYDTVTESMYSDMSRAEAYRVFALVLSPVNQESRERVFGLYNEEELPEEIRLAKDIKLEAAPEKLKAISALMDMIDTKDQPIIAMPESKLESRPNVTSDYSQSDEEEGEDDESDSTSSASSGMYIVQDDLDEDLSQLTNDHVGGGGSDIPSGRGFFFCVTTKCKDDDDGDVEHLQNDETTSDVREEPDRRQFDEDVLVETETRILHLSEDRVEYDTYLIQQVEVPYRPETETEHASSEDLSGDSSMEEDVTVAIAQEQSSPDGERDDDPSATSGLESTEIIPTQMRSEPFSHPDILGGDELREREDDGRLDLDFDIPTATEVTFEEVVLPASHKEDVVIETDFVSKTLDPDEDNLINFDALNFPESYASRFPTIGSGGDDLEEGDFYLESGPREPLADGSFDSKEPHDSSQDEALITPTETETSKFFPPVEFVDNEWTQSEAKIEKAQFRLSIEIDTPTKITFKERVLPATIYQGRIDETVTPTQLDPTVNVPINFGLLKNDEQEDRNGEIERQRNESDDESLESGEDSPSLQPYTTEVSDLEEGDYYLESGPREYFDNENRDHRGNGIESPVTVIETQTPDYCLPKTLGADKEIASDGISEDDQLGLSLDIDRPTEVYFEEAVLPLDSDANVVDEIVTPQILDPDKRQELNFEFCYSSKPDSIGEPTATGMLGKDSTMWETGEVDFPAELAGILNDGISNGQRPVERKGTSPAYETSPEEPHCVQTAIAPSPVDLNARLVELDPDDLPGGSKFIVVGLPTDDVFKSPLEPDVVPLTKKEEETEHVEDLIAPHTESFSSSSSSSSSSESGESDAEECSYRRLDSDTVDGDTENQHPRGGQSSDSDDNYNNASGRMSSSDSSSCSSNDTAQHSSSRDLLDGSVNGVAGNDVYKEEGESDVSDNVPTELSTDIDHPVELQVFLEKDPIDACLQDFTGPVDNVDITRADREDNCADVEYLVETPINAASEDNTEVKPLQETPTLSFTVYLGKSPIEDVPAEYEVYLEKGPRQPPDVDFPDGQECSQQSSEERSDLDDKLDNINSEECIVHEEYEGYLEQVPRQPLEIHSTDGQECPEQSSEDSSDLDDKLDNIDSEEYIVSEEYEAYLEKSPRYTPDLDSPDGQDYPEQSSEESSDLDDKLDDMNSEEHIVTEEFEEYLEKGPRPKEDLEKHEDDTEQRLEDNLDHGTDTAEENMTHETHEQYLERSPLLQLDDESQGEHGVFPEGSPIGAKHTEEPEEYEQYFEKVPRPPLEDEILEENDEIPEKSQEDYNYDPYNDKPEEFVSSGPKQQLGPLEETLVPQRIPTVESIFHDASKGRVSVNDSEESDTTESYDLTPPRGRVQSTSASSFSDSDTNHEDQNSVIDRPSVIFALTGRPSYCDVPEGLLDREEPAVSLCHPEKEPNGEAIKFEGRVEVYQDDVFHERTSVTSYVEVPPDTVEQSKEEPLPPSGGGECEGSQDRAEPVVSLRHGEEEPDGEAIVFEGRVEVYQACQDNVFHEKRSVTSYVEVRPETGEQSMGEPLPASGEGESDSNVSTYYQETETVNILQQTTTVVASYSPVRSQIV